MAKKKNITKINSEETFVENADVEVLKKSNLDLESSIDVQSVTGDLGPRRPNLKKFIIPVLRRATYRWKPRTEAMTNARVERGKYKCAMCEDVFERSQIVVDHVKPVVAIVEGFTNWDIYVDRMLPEVDGFQILCNPCHDSKTMIEDTLRAQYNQERKKLNKKNKKDKV